MFFRGRSTRLATGTADQEVPTQFVGLFTRSTTCGAPGSHRRPRHRHHSARWHATWTSGGKGRSAGSSTRHRSTAMGQRGWNRQPGRDVDRARRLALQALHAEAAPPRCAPRGDRSGERARVGVTRHTPDRLGAARLHDPPEVHHRDPVRDPPDHAQVMGHEQDADAAFLAQVEQQVEDLRAHGHVHRRHGLVAHQDVRSWREGTRDGGALELAAGQRVGMAVRQRRVQTH